VIAGPDAAERARRLLDLFDQGPGKLSFELRFTDGWRGDGARVELRPGNHPVPTSMVRIKEGAAGLLYTADCRYRPGLAAANAAGCAAMIHEATYPEAGLPAETGHSSARQAGMAAREAGVKRLFLCHFEPAAWAGGDPRREAGQEFAGEVTIPEPGAWYTLEP